MTFLHFRVRDGAPVILHRIKNKQVDITIDLGRRNNFSTLLKHIIYIYAKTSLRIQHVSVSVRKNKTNVIKTVLISRVGTDGGL